MGDKVERMRRELPPEVAARLDDAKRTVMAMAPFLDPDVDLGRVVAFVPARGGSKRVPRKNMAEVGGITLLGRAIRVARQADSGVRLVVSTDMDHLTSALEGTGIEVHARPLALCGDGAQIEDAIEHWLTDAADVQDDDVIVMLQPTSPFRRPETVRACVRAVRTTGLPCLTVRRDHAYAFTGIAEGERVRWHREQLASWRPRTQELDALVVENGCVYAFTAAHFRSTKNRMAQEMAFVEVSQWESLDIDTEEDLRTARALAPLIEDGRLV